MKKAQVLSAIALALALGVVAPVASTYAESRTTVTTPDEEKNTATVAEVNSTIAAIEAQAEYKAYVALSEANADNAAYTTEAAQQAIIAAAYKAYTGNEYDGADTYTATLAAAKGVNNYAKWSALVDAMEAADNGATSDKQKAEAIISAAEALGYKFADLDDENWTTNLSDVKTEIGKDTAYTNAKTYVEAVSGAEDALTASNESVANLKSALAGVNVDSRDIEAAAANETNPIAELKKLADAQLKTTRGAAYVTLISNVKAATADPDDLEANYTLIENLKAAYKTASGSDLNVTTPTDPSTPDDTTTTTIESADGSVSVKGELQAGLVVEAKEAEEKDEMFKKAFGDKKFFVYDIKIKGQNGYVTTFDKDVTVTVKVPENINGAKAGIYYINAEGSASKIASTYNAEAKTLTFTTNHFSYYAIVEDNGVNVSDSGVLAAADGTASSTVAIVAGIATALTAAGAGVVAYRNARRASKEA